MKFVYLILIHKNPSQLRKMIEALDDGNHFFVIHIDLKESVHPFLKEIPEDIYDRVFFVPNRFAIIWGHFSMVQAMLSIIQFALDIGLEADYFHLLSGQDYPLKSNEVIKDFFVENNGKSFMHYFKLPSNNWAAHENGMLRINYKWYFNNFQTRKFNNLDLKRNTLDFQSFLSSGTIPYGGSQWWSLHKSCIKYLIEACKDTNPLFNFFKYCLIPDEIIFHTMLLNSPYADTIVNNNLRYIRWQQGKAHPFTFTIEDKDEIINSDCFFARKFDPLRDNEIIEFIKSERNKNNSCAVKKVKESSKNCVISAVGKNSLHNEWINGSIDFDLHLMIYDDSYNQFKNDTSHIYCSKGQKFSLLGDYLLANKDILEKYDYFYIPDDDISIDPENIRKLFWYMKEYRLDIAQPALSNSYYTFKHTLRKNNSIIRFTNFVEMMHPCFSKEALKKVLFTFKQNKTGYGIDCHWSEILDFKKYNMAIIDDIYSEHTRPVQSQKALNINDLKEYLRRYKLQLRPIELN